MATTTTTTRTARPSVAKTRRVGRIVLAGGLVAAFASTAVLADRVLRDDGATDSPATVVVGPFNGLPDLNDLGVVTAPTTTIVVPAPFNGLPNLTQLGVALPTTSLSGR
jgi:hypothetical protein